MTNLAIVLIGAAAILTAVAAWRLTAAWFRYRGRMVITCPENERPAGVSVDVRHAAATGLSRAPELRLSDCSRWPERADCGQACLKQIQDSPENCLVRGILVRWYQGKDCAWCSRPIGEIHLAEPKPALLMSDQVSLQWAEIPADRLHEVLAAARPLCFSCHTANSMVRTHPELVIDRSRPMLSGSPRVPHS